MSDAAAFSATLIDVKLIRTRQCVQFVFEEDVTKLPPNILEVLGGIAALASGKIHCGIARLSRGTGEDRDDSLKSGRHALTSESDSTKGTTPEPVTKTSPSWLPSQSAWQLCNRPTGRVYLEQRRRHAIPADNHINNLDEAKHVLRAWLGIESLSELDSDPRAAAEWKKIEADYKTWLTAAKYVPEPGDYM